MFCLVNGIEELQHSEKQMFDFQKEHYVQRRQILKTQIGKMIKDKMVQTFRIICNFQNEKYPI